MAGYQRFVAYVYEYRKGKKDSSSGYVRVEARDRRCLIEVHLRCVGLEPGSRCRVYGFVRREGLMDGILIGSCVTGREQIECVLETETENIGDRGKNLRDLGGMLLISDAGGFWGTEWDDQPIRPENFREWKKEKTEPQKKSEKTGIEKAGAEEQKNQKEADKIMTVEEVQDLEKILWNEVGTKQDYEAEYGQKPLGEFVREIVGLDMNAAKEAFAQYLNDASLDSRQIYFVNQIVEYIVHNGMMKDLSVLQETPFTDQGSIVEVFTDLSVWMGIRQTIEKINANAVAA